ncbi:MAG TPA: lysylphosphatidylglycerol synthase domain-containing protein [Vicinamibacterales bacterium]|nr:lysylphosphatidylglycerol synthase domain-containing protein [Vicinamibacterales bacterium]
MTDRNRILQVLVPVVGLALLGGLFVQLGPWRILSLLQSIGWSFFLVLAAFGGQECFRALALRRCLTPGDRPPFLRVLLVQFFAEAVRTVTHTGPFLSEPARAWMFGKQGVDSTRAYGAAVSEVIANSVISALIPIFVLAFALWRSELSQQLRVLSLVLVWGSIVYVTAMVMALATRAHVIGAIVRIAGLVPVIGRRLKRDSDRVRRMEEAALLVSQHQPSAIFQVVLLELGAQAMLVIENYWAIGAMGQPISMATALLVECLTKAANGIQLFGATEAGYAVVFNWLGMMAAVGFTLSLVKRLRSLVVTGLAFGLLSKPHSDWAVQPTSTS